MYSTCLFCHSDLGSNEVIESFPVGRRLAFDAATGRLWVICRKCERWNLTPIEERWEAVEQCERLFSSTRMRVSTDNIGLSRLREGLELVRIGKPLRPEMAAWRYGDQFGKRRRNHLLITGAVGVTAAGLMIAGPATGLLAGGGYGAYQMVSGIYRVMRDRIVRARLAVPGRDEPLVLRGRDMKRIVLSAADGDWSLRVRGRQSRKGGPAGADVTFNGADALRAAATILPAVNHSGANKTQVADAVTLMERESDPARLFVTAAGMPTPRGKRGRGTSFVMIGSVGGFSGVGRYLNASAEPSLGTREAFVDRLPRPVRLALEMAAHEDIERRAMEGELSMLEAAWRQAEEIAAISDNLLVPASVDAEFDKLKG